jgi:hypothetical protein
MKIGRLVFLSCISLSLVSISKAQSDSSKQQIRHVVIVTFKPGTSDSSKHIVDKAYRQAALAFPMVSAFEWGWDANDNTQNKHVYVTTFNSKGDLTTYNASPQVQEVKKKSASKVVNTTTIDYPVNP